MKNPCFNYNFNSLDYCFDIEHIFIESVHIDLDASLYFQKEWEEIFKKLSFVGERIIENFKILCDGVCVIVFDKVGKVLYDSTDCYYKVVLTRYDVAQFELDKLEYVLKFVKEL